MRRRWRRGRKRMVTRGYDEKEEEVKEEVEEKEKEKWEDDDGVDVENYS